MEFKKSNNNKILFLAVGAIIIIILILIVILSINKVNDESQSNVNETVQENFEEDTNLENNDSTETDYYERPESWYKDPYNTGTATMPDLVGMNCKDLRNYLDNNYLYFIKNINYKFNDSAKGEHLLPTKILSTIPPAGTELDPFTDTSITVLSEYVYGVEGIRMELPSSDFEKQNFGKIIKIQLGNDENQYVEHIIGQSFITRNNALTTIDSKVSWDTVKEKKCSYIVQNDITIANDHPNNTLDYRYVKGKVWVDGELLKEIVFTYLDGVLSEATWK